MKKQRIYGWAKQRKIRPNYPFANFGSAEEEPWPSDIRDSTTWLDGEAESQIQVYAEVLQRMGLKVYSQAPIPSLIPKDSHKGRVVRTLARWKVGLFFVFDDKRDFGAVGPWHLGGKMVMDKLVALPAGPKRVRLVAALAAFVAVSEGGGVVDQALAFIRENRRDLRKA